MRKDLKTLVATTAATAGLAASALAVAPAAQADFSPYVQVWSRSQGDCTAYAGAQYMGSGGAAVGAGQLPCAARHSTTSVTVSLVRGLPGQSYRVVASSTSNFTNSLGMGSRQLNTGSVCGPGAWWYTQVDYTVSGVGSGTLTNAPAWYDPCGPNA